VDTKERILDSAERLFATHGFDGTSLRDITADAGVNLAAVNYHFGSKLSLLRSVFARRFEPINRDRIKRLDKLEEYAATNGRMPEVEDILRALFAPIFERLREANGGWGQVIQLVGHTHSELNADIRNAFMSQFEEVVVRFMSAIRRVLPHLSDEVLRYRCLFLIGAMAHTLVFSQHRGLPLLAPVPDPRVSLENLVSFCVAGLRAPAPTHAAVTTGEPQ
jgi:AcrR family transcriptional regulator